MHLVTRMIARGRRGDAGAVAVVVAITSVLIFSVGALAVDLGNGFARKRSQQTTADLAALAGAAHLGRTGGVVEARKAAIDYIRTKDPTASDDGVAIPACTITSVSSPCWDNDGDVQNGEIYFTDDANTPTTGVGATRIRVLVPRRTVNFGLGAVMGYQKVTVQKAATAGIFSPGGAKAPPFFLLGQDRGLTCIKDDSNSNNAPMRAALLPRTAGNNPSLTSINPTTAQELQPVSFTITGKQLNGVNQVYFTSGGTDYTAATLTATNQNSVAGTTSAAMPAGTYTVSVTETGSTTRYGSLTYTLTVKPAPPAAPTVTAINPTSGPELQSGTFTLTGTGFQGTGQTTVTFGGFANATNVQVTSATTLTGTLPLLPAGAYTVQVSNSNGTSTGGPTYTATAAVAPTISIAPNRGPDTGALPVVITVVGMDATTLGPSNILFGGIPVQSIESPQTPGSVTVIPPPGTAGTTVDVYIKTLTAESNRVPYTYFSDPTACPGPSANRGYIDEPRLSGNAQAVIVNIQQGIDHNLHTYQTYKLPAGANERPRPPDGLDCDAVEALAPGTTLRSGSSTPAMDVNCVRLRTGTITSFEKGFFDPAPDGRMYQLDPPAGTASTGTIQGYDNVDVDDLFSSRFVDPANMAVFKTSILTGTPPTLAQQGWLKDAVLKCPRFAILPVTNAPIDLPNGTSYYPIVDFKGIFIMSLPIDTSAQYGFRFQGGSLRTVKAVVFDLSWLNASISSSAVIATQAYIGTGPVITKLIRDSGDGTY